MLPGHSDHTGEVSSGDAVARVTKPIHQAHHVRIPGHDEVVARMHPGCTHADEHFALTGPWHPHL